MKRICKHSKQLLGLWIFVLLLIEPKSVFAKTNDYAIRPEGQSPRIVVLDEEEITIPEDLKEALKADKVKKADLSQTTMDALLISKEALKKSELDGSLKKELKGVLGRKKMLLVYGASIKELKEQLAIKIPVTTTETSVYAVATLLGGGTQICLGRPVSAAGEGLRASARDPGRADLSGVCYRDAQEFCQFDGSCPIVHNTL